MSSDREDAESSFKASIDRLIGAAWTGDGDAIERELDDPSGALARMGCLSETLPMSLKVNDVVEYRSLCGYTERGKVIKTDGCRVLVEYSPWGDSFWSTMDQVKRVDDAEARAKKKEGL